MLGARLRRLVTTPTRNCLCNSPLVHNVPSCRIVGIGSGSFGTPASFPATVRSAVRNTSSSACPSADAARSTISSTRSSRPASPSPARQSRRAVLPIRDGAVFLRQGWATRRLFSQSLGGCHPAMTQHRRASTISTRFKRTATTVALPIAVLPRMISPDKLHSKWSAHD